MSTRNSNPGDSSGPADQEIAEKWPLHWMVWNNDHKALNRLLEQHVYDKEEKDPRGRTPLHLACTLGYRNCMEVLLYHEASTLALNRHQWNVAHEAVCTGNADIVHMTMMVKDQEQVDEQAKIIPLMLEKLQTAPDFYAEMKWEFTSWIPFLSRVCPSDTYKIWKKGTQVRVDTSLIGFENMQWLRGNQSFIFNVTAEGAKFVEIDHDKKLVWEHPVQLVCKRQTNPREYMAEHSISVVRRLSSPVVSTAFDTNSIEFQRQKAGIWGFRSDRTEVVNGHEAKVFAASGLELVTRTRVDHLPKEEREKQKEGKGNPLQSLLGMDDELPMDTNVPGGGGGGSAAANLLLGSTTVMENSQMPQLTSSEYFTPPKNPKEYDAIGHPVEVYNRVQTLKATVWLAEEHPLSLQDQIMPVVDLMAVNNAHFAKFKDFITLQMPSGFPIKFEIPLFHLMSARVTFGNINGSSQPVPYVSLEDETIVDSQPHSSTEFQMTTFKDFSSAPSLVKRRHTSSTSSDDNINPSTSSSTKLKHADQSSFDQELVTRRRECSIKEEAFDIPKDYQRPGQWRGNTLADEEEELLQMAIRQSLLEHNSSSSTTHSESNSTGGDSALMLSEALKDDSIMSQANSNSFSVLAPYAVVPSSAAHQQDDDFQLALALSRVQAQEEEERRQRQRLEDEELERVLKLSLEDK